MPEEKEKGLHDEIKELRADHINFEKEFIAFKAEFLTEFRTEFRNLTKEMRIQNERVNKRESEIEALRLLHEEDRTAQDKEINDLKNRMTAVESKGKTLAWVLTLGLSALAAIGAIGIFWK